MSRSETVRGLERGLQVLDALRANPIASLHELHLATGIPKPSLLRVLNTLIRAGYVARRLADNRYRVSVLTRNALKGDRHDRIAEAAAPVLHRLCHKVSWPSDLLVPAGDHMMRRESSRSQSPFVVHPLSEQNTLGQPIGWLLSAVGRAYLAFCPDKERDRIVGRLAKSIRPEDRLAREPDKLAKVLAQTRRRGYGTRDPIFVGGHYGSHPVDDGMASIAVPLRDGSRVHGSINILWIRSAFTVDAFAARHLGDLQSAATEIVRSLHSDNKDRARLRTH